MDRHRAGLGQLAELLVQLARDEEHSSDGSALNLSEWSLEAVRNLDRSYIYSVSQPSGVGLGLSLPLQR
jgi:hypothetical protein